MKCLFILLILGVANAQQKVVPVNITYEIPQPISVNGSSEIGRCSNGGPTCFEPTTSVLCDGKIPPLYGLNRHQWAAQLLTLNASGEIAILTFDFTGQSEYKGAKGVEVVLFNCPEWGIEVGHILILHRNALNVSRRFLSDFTIFLNLTSCDSFVKVGMSFDLNDTILSLAFLSSSWVHLAEVTFYTQYNQTSNIDFILSNTFTTSEPPENVTSIPNISSDMASSNIAVISAVITVNIMVMLAVLLAIIVLKYLRRNNRQKRKEDSKSITTKGSTTTDVFGSVTTEETARNLPIQSVYDDLFPLNDETSTNIPEVRIEDAQARPVHDDNPAPSNEGTITKKDDATSTETLPTRNRIKIIIHARVPFDQLTKGTKLNFHQ